MRFASAQHLVIDARLLALKRAFSNLVGNAVRFGTNVTTTVSTSKEHVEISIEDDGPGIPDEKLKSVLEPFVRLEDSRNRATGGVGLGLTIANANIEANGGTMSLTNRKNGGFCVMVKLPRRAS